MKKVSYNPYQGVQTTYHVHDDCLIVKKSMDVTDMLKGIAEERAATRGERWGNGFRKVGTIPMHVLAKMMQTGEAFDEKAVRKWLKENPAFVAFERELL